MSRGNLEGFSPGDGESRGVAELGCSGGVPTFLWHSGGDGSKGRCHTWACSLAGVRGNKIHINVAFMSWQSGF